MLLAGSLRMWAQSPPAPAQEPPELSPPQVFSRVSPSVFIVEASDARGAVLAFGSGVAVSPHELVTNGHVVEGASSVRIRRATQTWEATVNAVDPDHDLARLHARYRDLPEKAHARKDVFSGKPAGTCTGYPPEQISALNIASASRHDGAIQEDQRASAASVDQSGL